MSVGPERPARHALLAHLERRHRAQFEADQVAGRGLDLFGLLADPTTVHRIGQALVESMPLGTDAIAGVGVAGTAIAAICCHASQCEARYLDGAGGGRPLRIQGGAVNGVTVACVTGLLGDGAAEATACQLLALFGARVRAVLCVYDLGQGGVGKLEGIGVRTYVAVSPRDLEAIRRPQPSPATRRAPVSRRAGGLLDVAMRMIDQADAAGSDGPSETSPGRART